MSTACQPTGPSGTPGAGGEPTAAAGQGEPRTAGLAGGKLLSETGEIVTFQAPGEPGLAILQAQARQGELSCTAESRVTVINNGHRDYMFAAPSLSAARFASAR